LDEMNIDEVAEKLTEENPQMADECNRHGVEWCRTCAIIWMKIVLREFQIETEVNAMKTCLHLVDEMHRGAEGNTHLYSGDVGKEIRNAIKYTGEKA